MSKNRTLKLLTRSRVTFVVLCALLISVLIISGLPQPSFAKKAPETVTLREAISSLHGAVVNQVTPLPSAKGKDMLLVDGNFYTGSGQDVAQNVQSKAKDGMPIVFVGPGFSEFCKSLKVGYQQFQYEIDGELYDAPLAARALRILPQETPDGEPVCAVLNVLGDSKHLTSGVIDALTDWNKRTAGLKSTRVEASQEFIDSISEPGILAMGDPPFWSEVYYWEYSSGDAWSPYGKLNVNHTYKKLYNDNSYDYRWYTLEFEYQTKPGKILYGSNWRTSFTELKCPVAYWGFGGFVPYWLTKYGPTTTTGGADATYTLGVTAGSGGAQVTLTWQNSYGTSGGVEVHDWGDFDLELAWWKHEINQYAAAGLNTYVSEPGYTFRMRDNGSMVCQHGEYQVSFAKPAFPRDHYFWSPNVVIDTFIYG